MTALRRVHQMQRLLTTTASSPSPVSLAFEHFAADQTSSNGPLVMVHGLYGSKQNWRSIAKSLPRQLSRDVYTLDLRNHGTSPHARPATYQAMAADIALFIQSNNLKDVVLLGHSLGGKTAMALALHPDYCNLLSKLIVVDISPAKGKVSGEFASYMKGMRQIKAKIEDGSISTKKQADELLQQYEQDLGVRQFLLTNLQPQDGTLKWRLSLDNLEEGIEHIGDFPYEPGERTFDKPTLFIKGEKSKYINRKSLVPCEQYFPHMKLETVEKAGHWVHAENPHKFVQAVVQFCKSA